MKAIAGCLLILLLSCSERQPITGSYQGNEEHDYETSAHVEKLLVSPRFAFRDRLGFELPKQFVVDRAVRYLGNNSDGYKFFLSSSEPRSGISDMIDLFSKDGWKINTGSETFRGGLTDVNDRIEFEAWPTEHHDPALWFCGLQLNQVTEEIYFHISEFD
ncbi:MAG: hypothetical protein AAF591_18530 [Verrucomicrobiota bacterium]